MVTKTLRNDNPKPVIDPPVDPTLSKPVVFDPLVVITTSSCPDKGGKSKHSDKDPKPFVFVFDPLILLTDSKKKVDSTPNKPI